MFQKSISLTQTAFYTILFVMVYPKGDIILGTGMHGNIYVFHERPVFGNFNIQYDVICYDMTMYVNFKKLQGKYT